MSTSLKIAIFIGLFIIISTWVIKGLTKLLTKPDGEYVQEIKMDLQKNASSATIKCQYVEGVL